MTLEARTRAAVGGIKLKSVGFFHGFSNPGLRGGDRGVGLVDGERATPFGRWIEHRPRVAGVTGDVGA